MFNIMKADLYRLSRSKGVYITSVLLLSLIILQVAISRTVEVVSVGSSGNSTGSGVFTGSTAALEMIKATDTLLYFILPFILFIGCADFSSEAVKNVLSNGISRGKYYLSKLVLSCAISTVILSMYIVLPTIIGTSMNGFGGTFDMAFISSIMKPFLVQWLLCIAVTCVGVFFIFTTRKAATVNGAYLSFCMLPMILISMLSMIEDRFTELINYEILTNIRMLAYFDFLSPVDIIRAISIGVFYILASTLLGIFIFEKSEIR